MIYKIDEATQNLIVAMEENEVRALQMEFKFGDIFNATGIGGSYRNSLNAMFSVVNIPARPDSNARARAVAQLSDWKLGAALANTDRYSYTFVYPLSYWESFARVSYQGESTPTALRDLFLEHARTMTRRSSSLNATVNHTLNEFWNLVQAFVNGRGQRRRVSVEGGNYIYFPSPTQFFGRRMTLLFPSLFVPVKDMAPLLAAHEQIFKSLAVTKRCSVPLVQRILHQEKLNAGK